MDAFLIVTSILLSVVLLFRYAVPIGKPKMSKGERLSDAAVKNKFKLLGKACSVTRRGFGIYYKQFDVKKVLRSLYAKQEKNISLCAWERALLTAVDTLTEAYEHSLDTVRLCYTLGHVGGLPRVYLFCSELVKSRNGAVSSDLISLALDSFGEYASLEPAEKTALPGMTIFCICGFICAIFSGASARYKAHARGIEDGKANKIDLDSITDGDYLSGLIDGAPIRERSVIRGIAESNGIDYISAYAAYKQHLADTYATVNAAVRSIYALNESRERSVAPAADIKSFPDKRTVTLFNIAPIILIIAFAVIVCIFVPSECAAVVPVAAILLYGGFRLPMLLFAPRYYCVDFSALLSRIALARKPKNKVVAYDSEIAYFGDEPQYFSNKIYGKTSALICDNRGKILFDDCEAVIKFKHGGRTYSLSEFGGVALRGKTVYRLFSDDVEIFAELTVAADYRCCVIKVTVVNRSSSPQTVQLSCATTERDGVVSCVNACGKNYVGSASCEVTALPFGKRSEKLVVAHGNCVSDVLRTVEYSLVGGTFEYSVDCASEYCDNIPNGIEPHSRLWRNNTDRLVGDRLHSVTVPRAGANTIISGDVAIELDDSGVTRIFNIYSNADYVQRNDINKVYLLFGDDGALWSPFGGDTHVVHGVGRTDYFCRYDGCVSKTTCIADSASGVLFDITFKNTSAVAKKIDVMFSAVAPADSKIVCGDNHSVAVKNETTPFIVACSLPIDEYAVRKEGWFARGKPNCTCGFRAGGIVPAAVMHVSLTLPPYGKESVCFCLSANGAEQITQEYIDNCYAKNVEYMEGFDRIILHTSSSYFNAVFAKSMYVAYIHGMAHCTELSPREFCAAIGCAKYVDKTRARGVLLSALRRERQYTREQAIIAMYAVSDYITFCDDKSLLRERIGKRNGVEYSVLSLCMRLLDCYEYDDNIDEYLRRMLIYVCEFFMRIINNDVRIRNYSELKLRLLQNSRLSSCAGAAGECLENCYLLFADGKYDAAYSLLNAFTEKLNTNFSAINPADLSLYCLIVIEMLLGVRMKSNRAKINPRVSKNCPHIEFDLRSDNGASAHVIVDESVDSGEWRMRVGNVAYAVNSFRIKDGKQSDITLYRSGTV